MLTSRLKHALLFFSTTVGTLVLCLCALAAEPDKPSGFSGYLLDSRGLDKDAKEPAWTETFESKGVSWRYLYQDGSIKIGAHKRVANEAHGDERSEYIRYDVETPGVVVFGHYVDYPSVYHETDPSVWVRSERPGLALAALVVFPKTKRPDDGAPLTALLLGSTYQKPGEWQKLDFPNGIDKTLEETVQAIRGEHKLPVDGACAYIRQIVLISEARYGRYSLWVDDLSIAEHIRPDDDALRQSERQAKFNPINLLSVRLQLSQTPIFWEDQETEANTYGEEPFAIDQAKAASNRNKSLEFSADALASLVSDQSGIKVADDEKKRTSLPRPTAARNKAQGFGSAFSATGGEPSFQESAFFIPTLDDDVAEPFETALAQNTPALRERVIPTDVYSSRGVGQTGFVNSETPNETQVSQASFGSDDDLLRLPPSPDYQTMNPIDYLVSGSGTLDSPEQAAEYGFLRQGENLVPNVHLTTDGNLESQDKKIYSIRAIEYNNEPFEFLKKMGFNAIWLKAPPTEEELNKAKEVGIWLIAQPPLPLDLVPDSTDNSGKTDGYFGGSRPNAKYDPVLVWDLGKGLRLERLDEFREKIHEIKSVDPHGRPVMGSVFSGVRDFTSGEKLDVVLLNREPLLSSLDLNDYTSWLKTYPDLAQINSVAFWNLIQTQPNEFATAQRVYFGQVDETPGIVSYEQMRQCVRASMSAGCRGLIFTSKSSLTGKDHKTQYRASALEALNLELQFLAPWFALGTAQKNLLQTSDNLGAVVMKASRASLVMPFSTEPNNQFVMGQDALYNWEATIPVPESYSASLLAPGALRKILSKRRAGGCSFSLEEGSMNSLVFFTQSDSISQKTAERAHAFGKRMAELAIGIARKRLDLYEQTVYGIQYVETHGAAASNAPDAPALAPTLDKAYAMLDEADRSLRRRDISQAYLLAERATREVRNAERTFWEKATSREVSRPVTPLSTSFYDMPVYLELYGKLVSGKIRATGSNLIVGGEMESPESTQDRGWKIYSVRSPNLTATASYQSTAAHSGERGLLVAVSPSTPNQPPAEAECPALCAEVAVPSRIGQLVCIQGWIKIPQKLTNSVDGVEIYDDQGGPALSLRFKGPCDWKKFAFYRISTSDDPMIVRFAFSGIGEVYLDDVAAYIVE